MLHQRFVRITEGNVYAEFVEDLIHVKGDGEVIMTETRTARVWYGSNYAAVSGNYSRNDSAIGHR